MTIDQDGASDATTRGDDDALYREVVAIDGPAAAGKTTVARGVADALQAVLFDTGVLYRALTLAAQRTGIDPADEARLSGLAKNISIEVTPPSVHDGRLYDVRVDGDDVTWAIRDQAVDAHVSQVSAHPAVRQALLPLQRRIAAHNRVVIVGRDIGTVVVPGARVKIYLDASVEQRARRRAAELERRGEPADYQQILSAMRERDAYDRSRSVAPLRAAADAQIVQTDGRPVEEIVREIVDLARGRGIGTSVASARAST